MQKILQHKASRSFFTFFIFYPTEIEDGKESMRSFPMKILLSLIRALRPKARVWGNFVCTAFSNYI